MSGVAFFDIEGTLIDGTLSSPFVRAGRAQRVFSRAALLRAQGYALASKVAPKSASTRLRWQALLQLLTGSSVSDILHVGEQAVEELRGSLKPAVLARMRAHLAEGDVVILLSGGMDEAARLLAAAVGATRGVGTRVVQDQGRYWGLLATPICQGEAKLRRASEIARELGADLRACTYYGDSAADIPLLAEVGTPVAVDPDRTLAAEAAQRGWGILRAGHVAA
jgi:HAD superfamily hydrolase (TIGR01490 family)